MLLSIQDLRVGFKMGRGVTAEAVKGVSFDIAENQTLALVGESGSGKSVTAMSILNLLPENAVRQGRIQWSGSGQPRDLLQTSLRELQTARKSPASFKTRWARSTRCSRSASSSPSR
jgi:peptide/nickel transport system ATP-binding protein